MSEICKVCLKKITGQQRFSGYHNNCLAKFFDSTVVSPKLEFSREVFRTEIQTYTKGMSISGVQKKLSVKIEDNKLKLTSLGGKFILKPTVEEFPELSQNEHLSMLIGKALDIETPSLGLVEFSDGELAYLIKRFDWKGNEKIQKEDMTQIFNLNRNDEQREQRNYKYSQSYEEVGLKLKEITGGKMSVVLDFFNRFVYNYMIQNGDYHLKNISVQAEKLSKDGFYDSLTPNYDSVMTKLHFPNESDLALDFLKDDEEPKIYKEVGFLTRPDFEELGSRIGLNPGATGIIFDKIRKGKPGIMELVANSFLGKERKQQYLDGLQYRMKKLGVY